MKNSLSLKAVTRPLSQTLHRYHLVMFVLIVAGSLAVALFSLHKIINVSTEQSTSSPTTTFDTATMERVEELQTRDNSDSSLVLPPGRINPLGE